MRMQTVQRISVLLAATFAAALLLLVDVNGSPERLPTYPGSDYGRQLTQVEKGSKRSLLQLFGAN